MDLKFPNRVHRVVVPFVQFIAGESLKLLTVSFASAAVEVPAPGSTGASGRATTLVHGDCSSVRETCHI